MRIEEIAAKGPKPFGEQDNATLDELVFQVESVLFKQHTPIGTTQVIRLLLSQPSDTQMKALVNWLRATRTAGKLDGCFTLGKPAPGTFGKPRIIWQLTQSKRDEVEEYTSI